MTLQHLTAFNLQQHLELGNRARALICLTLPGVTCVTHEFKPSWFFGRVTDWTGQSDWCYCLLQQQSQSAPVQYRLSRSPSD